MTFDEWCDDQQGWKPTRWLSVIGEDGKLWCGTSDKDEAVRSMRPGDRIYRQWMREEREMREEPL